jgi:hypothetical protein
MLSAIIAALEARKKIRKSRLPNDANARGRVAAVAWVLVLNIAAASDRVNLVAGF